MPTTFGALSQRHIGGRVVKHPNKGHKARVEVNKAFQAGDIKFNQSGSCVLIIYSNQVQITFIYHMLATQRKQGK